MVKDDIVKLMDRKESKHLSEATKDYIKTLQNKEICLHNKETSLHNKEASLHNKHANLFYKEASLYKKQTSLQEEQNILLQQRVNATNTTGNHRSWSEVDSTLY